MVGGFCIKYFMFCFNICIMIGGSLLFSTGIAGICKSGVRVTDEIFVEETMDDHTLGILLIIVGLLTIAIAMLGCCGAVKESKCLLVTYVTLLILIMLAMLILAVVNLVESKHFRLVVPVVLVLRHLQNETKFHEDFEQEYECCGLNGPNEYISSKGRLPSSCCAKTLPECTLVNAFASCRDVVTNDVVDASLIMGYTSLVVALTMMIGIMMGGYVAWKVREAGIAGEEIVFSYKDFRNINMYGVASNS